MKSKSGTPAPAKPTPGPWSVEHQHSRTQLLSIFTPHGWCARILGVNDESKANAQLIAAAPDMLAALQAIREWILMGETITNANGVYLQPFVKANNLAEAAIAKATGGSL